KACAIARRAFAVGGEPASCDEVAALGGDPSAIAPAGDPSSGDERLVPERAVEARRVAGETQIQPSAGENAAIRASKEKKITSVFKVCISPRGGVSIPSMLEASPAADWNRRLFEAVSRWRYSPFTV